MLSLSVWVFPPWGGDPGVASAHRTSPCLKRRAWRVSVTARTHLWEEILLGLETLSSGMKLSVRSFVCLTSTLVSQSCHRRRATGIKRSAAPAVPAAGGAGHVPVPVPVPHPCVTSLCYIPAHQQRGDVVSAAV